MAQIGEAFVVIRADTGDFERKATGALRNVASAAAGLAIGAKVFDFFKGGAEQLGELQRVGAQTNAVLKSTGGVANVSAREVEAYGSKIERLTGIDQEQIQAGENLLLTFKGVRNEVGEGPKTFDRARQAALDLSVAFGQDMTQSSVLVGKALENPIQGLTALQRVGVTFNAGQKETIKSLVETGDVAGAQAIILKELESQIGGSAAAYGETLPAKVAKAQQAFGDMQQHLTVALLPGIELGTDLVIGLSGAVEGLPGPLATAGTLTLGLGASALFLARPLESLINIGGRVGESLTAAGGGAGLLNKALPFAAAAGGFAVLAGGVLVALKLGGAFDDAHASGEELAQLEFSKLLKEFTEIDSKSRELGETLRSEAADLGIVETEVDKLGKKLRDGADSYKVFTDLAEADIGKATRVRDSFAERGISVEKFDRILRDVANAHRDNEGAADRNKDAVDRFATKQENANKKAEEAKAALDAMNQAFEEQISLLDTLNGKNISATETDLEFRDALEEVNQQLVDSNSNLDINTTEGRDNISALIDAAGAARDHAAAVGTQTSSVDAATLTLLGNEAKLYDVVRATSASDQEAARYTATLFGIPASRLTEIYSNADVQRILAEQYRAELDRLDGRTVTVRVNTIESLVRRDQEAAAQGLYGQHGLIVKGSGAVAATLHPPEAVVPLGQDPVASRDRDRVMKQAGLFQINPMQHGGIAGYPPASTPNWDGADKLNLVADRLAVFMQLTVQLVSAAVAESLPTSATQRAKLRELEHYASRFR